MANKSRVNRNFIKIAVTAALLAVVLLSSTSSGYERLRSLSVDASLWIRSLYQPTNSTVSDQVVVIAIDEQTYRTAPFSETPKVMWTPQIAEVQDAVLNSGAKVLGYDIIFPTSVDSFIRGYEGPFLRSVSRWSRAGKLVLGQAQHSTTPLAPHAAQLMVSGGKRNLRSLNLVTDLDEVTRRPALAFKTDQDEWQSSFALELAIRSGLELQTTGNSNDNSLPELKAFKGYLDFNKGREINTYSFADLYHCATSGNENFFVEHFAGKTVLLGTVLDKEDRKLTSKRLFTDESDYQPSQLCSPDLSPELSISAERETLPGVYIHAKSVDALLNNSFLMPLPSNVESILLAALAVASAIAGFFGRPAHSLALYALIVGGIILTDQLFLSTDVLIPTFGLILATLITYATVFFYQYLTTFRKQSKTRKLFELYLDPAVIEQMMASNQEPTLGGEKRKVTIWFSDIASFTTISEKLTPAELVFIMNRYFTVVTRLIEEHGGFVDKYIGDAVVGIFGAPLDDPHHAGHAISCALLVQRKLEKLNSESYFGASQLNTRIGINTGEVLVGNIGSNDRFNYTVMGDAVNLASRLEGANKVFDSKILIAESTAELLPKSMVARPLGSLQVKGKTAPINVFEPIDMRFWDKPVFMNPKLQKDRANGTTERLVQESATLAESNRLAERFAQALSLWRSGNTEGAIAILNALDSDRVAQKMLSLIRRGINGNSTEFGTTIKLDEK